MAKKRTRRASMQDAIATSRLRSHSSQTSETQQVGHETSQMQPLSPSPAPAVQPPPIVGSSHEASQSQQRQTAAGTNPSPAPVVQTPPIVLPSIAAMEASQPQQTQAATDTAVEGHNSTGPSSSAPTTSGSSSRGGRGGGKLPPGWGEPTFKKYEVNVGPHGGLIGQDAGRYSSVVGCFARMCNRFPLNHRDWHCVPNSQKESVWEEIRGHTTMPPEGHELTMKILCASWKDYKSTLKRKYYTPYKNSTQPIVCGDKRVDEDQWKMLVDYWRLEDVQKEAEQNKQNRSHIAYPPATGRMPHSVIQDQMASQGQSTSQYDMFLATRRWRGKQVDGLTADMIERLEEEWQALPESERTDEEKNRIFHRLFGPDSRGRVRCMGKGPTPTSISQSSATSCSRQVEEIRAEFETRMADMEERMRREREVERQAYELRIAELQATMEAFVSRVDSGAFNIAPTPPVTRSTPSPGVGSTSRPHGRSDAEDGGTHD